MRRLYIFGLVGLAGLIIGLAWADQMTFTTYYPAPFGVYRQMRVAGLGNALLIEPLTMANGDVTRIRFQDPDGGTGPMDIEYLDDGTPALAITGGNLGIGTANPQKTLHIAGGGGPPGLAVGPFTRAGQCIGRIEVTGSGGEFRFADRGLLSWPGSPVAGDGWVWYSNARVARLWTEVNGDLIGITGAGNVGIGTTGPVGKLHVDIDGDGDGDLFVEDAGANKGNVGIGTTGPGSKLEVNGTITSSGGLCRIDNNSNNFQDYGVVSVGTNQELGLGSVSFSITAPKTVLIWASVEVRANFNAAGWLRIKVTPPGGSESTLGSVRWHSESISSYRDTMSLLWPYTASSTGSYTFKITGSNDLHSGGTVIYQHRYLNTTTLY